MSVGQRVPGGVRGSCPSVTTQQTRPPRGTDYDDFKGFEVFERFCDKGGDQVQATRGLATRDWGRRTQGRKAQVDEMLYLGKRSLYIYSCITLCPAWEPSRISVWGFGLSEFARECSRAWLIGMSGDRSGRFGL
jgi:hypothetical protein